MAKITAYPDSSCIFMGNPIVYTVLPLHVEGDSISFHRVILEVKMADGETYKMSQPVNADNSAVEFDISSCFRASAGSYEFAPVVDNMVRYKKFTAKSIVAHDEWVDEGVLIEQGYSSSASYVALMGAFSDYERLNEMLTPTLSRKPASGEIVCAGDKVVYARFGDYEHDVFPCSVIKEVPSSARGEVSIDGRLVYAVPVDHNSLQLQFVNSRGCIESIRAWAINTEKMKSASQQNVLARFERFNAFGRIHQNKHIKPSEITLTSGFVDDEWAKWWAYEFCMSEHHWMLHDGIWLPCHVSVDDSFTVIDRSKVQLNFVQFAITPDVNGALW